MSIKSKTIYEIFGKYTKDQVDDMLSKLTIEERRIITLRYGKNLEKPIILKELDSEESYEYYMNLLPKMKKLLANSDYIFEIDEENHSETTNQKNTTKSELDNQTDSNKNTTSVSKPVVVKNSSKPIVQEKEDYIRILELLKKQDFGQMLNELSPKEAIIICLKLGYVDGKYFTTEAISRFLRINPDEINETTKKFLLSYRNDINEFIDKAVEYTTDQESQNILFKR